MMGSRQVVTFKSNVDKNYVFDQPPLLNQNIKLLPWYDLSSPVV